MLNADWSMTGTKEFIEKEIGRGFKIKLGWIETSTDTAFVEQINSYDKDLKFCVYIWNRTGIRAELSVKLGQPVHKGLLE